MIKEAVKKTQLYLEMIKFEHSIFALPFAYLGMLMAAEGLPEFFDFLWISAAMVSFRSMAMGANRLIDRAIDAANPRTSNRALPARKLKTPFVLGLTILFLVFFEYSAYRLGDLCFRLSPIPVLMAWLYPWMKRFTWLSHMLLGMILGIAPYGAWLAVRGEFSWIPGFFLIGVTCWVAGFDIVYALQDLAFDKQYGLYSFPARFGEKNSLRLTFLLHVIAFAAWFGAGWLAGLGTAYWIGLVVVAGLLVREHWLVRNFGVAKIQEAFFLMNAVVSVALFLSVLADFSVRGWL